MNRVPYYTDEERAALCTIALSLVDGKVYNPNFLMKFMHEGEGFGEEEVYEKIHTIMKDFPQAYAVIKSMTDISKREYAACFFAATISKAEFDARRDSRFVDGWRNCRNYLLNIKDDSFDFDTALEQYGNRKG